MGLAALGGLAWMHQRGVSIENVVDSFKKASTQPSTIYDLVHQFPLAEMVNQLYQKHLEKLEVLREALDILDLNNFTKQWSKITEALADFILQIQNKVNQILQN